MTVVNFDTASNAGLRAHRRSFLTFERLVLFAILHIALTLSCLALAFLDDAPLIAVLLGIGGTLALIVAFAVTGSSAEN